MRLVELQTANMQKTELPHVAVLLHAGDDVGDHQVHVLVGPDGDDAESELLHVAVQ